MSTIADLVSVQGMGNALSDFGGVAWFATIANPVPITTSDDIYVIIPDISSEHKFGPCRWFAPAIPSIGDECLVIFNNRQEPIVFGLN